MDKKQSLVENTDQNTDHNTDHNTDQNRKSGEHPLHPPPTDTHPPADDEKKVTETPSSHALTGKESKKSFHSEHSTDSVKKQSHTNHGKLSHPSHVIPKHHPLRGSRGQLHHKPPARDSHGQLHDPHHKLHPDAHIHYENGKDVGVQTSARSSHPNLETKPKKKSVVRRDSLDGMGLPFVVLDKSKLDMIKETEKDTHISKELSDVTLHYKGGYEVTEKGLDAKFRSQPHFNYNDMTKLFKKPGIDIPIPTDADFSRLESSHGSKWDPEGVVVEYYSPVLRSFVPVNLRGRYRGCWQEETCVQGIDISKVKPKPDALEGFVDRGRQDKIEEKYKKMSAIAQDKAHLDFLIEVQKCQAETLPIPLLFDVVNFGLDVLKENMEYIVQEECLPPTNRIYQTTKAQLLNLRRKVQVYASLGLEPIHGGREGMGKVSPMWKRTRDELIAAVLKKREADEAKEQAKLKRVAARKSNEELHKKGHEAQGHEGTPSKQPNEDHHEEHLDETDDEIAVLHKQQHLVESDLDISIIHGGDQHEDDQHGGDQHFNKEGEDLKHNHDMKNVRK